MHVALGCWESFGTEHGESLWLLSLVSGSLTAGQSSLKLSQRAGRCLARVHRVPSRQIGHDGQLAFSHVPCVPHPPVAHHRSRPLNSRAVLLHQWIKTLLGAV